MLFVGGVSFVLCLCGCVSFVVCSHVIFISTSEASEDEEAFAFDIPTTAALDITPPTKTNSSNNNSTINNKTDNNNNSRLKFFILMIVYFFFI
jgi:hypothetical protein